MVFFFMGIIVTKTIVKSHTTLIELSDVIDTEESEKEGEKEIEELKTAYDYYGLKQLYSNFTLPHKNFSIESLLNLHHPEITSPPPRIS